MRWMLALLTGSEYAKVAGIAKSLGLPVRKALTAAIDSAARTMDEDAYRANLQRQVQAELERNRPKFHGN